MANLTKFTESLHIVDNKLGTRKNIVNQMTPNDVNESYIKCRIEQLIYLPKPKKL